MVLCTTGPEPKPKSFFPSLLQRIAWLPLRILFSWFGSLQVKGIENLQISKGPIIIASNHVSELDPLLIVASIPFFSRHLPLFYVSRVKGQYGKGLRNLVYGGLLFKMLGAYPAYTGLHNYEEALRHHIQILESGGSVGIFPMGGIVLKGTDQKPKGGVVYLSQSTRAQIVPVSIKGLEGITIKQFFRVRPKILVTYGKPIESSLLSSYTTTNYVAGAELVMGEVSKLF
ncbi:MAG: hypothetical protein AB203_02170 [Parcubacteria bacterium C7867-008]|nr:MAG: hypothetical protein AB203_02170 [Parcubacteria bacterium C7867-008]